MAYKRKGLTGIFGVATIAAALTGCGGSSSDSSSSSAGSATNSASSAGPAVASAAGTIALSSSTYQAPASSSAVVTVYRSSASTGTASVNYSTVNGSAVAGVDYTATSGSLTWQNGDTSARTVVVPTHASAHGKVFAISLTSIEGDAGYGSPSSATIQVTTSTASASSSSSSSGGAVSSSSSSSGGSSSGTTLARGSSSSGGSSSSSGTTTGAKTATLSWSAPTDNTDGSALTNLQSYNIYYGTSSSAMTNKIAVSVGLSNYVIQNMNSGTWYFAMTSVNSSGVESPLSGTVQVTL
jgi:hypothetical protein